MALVLISIIILMIMVYMPGMRGAFVFDDWFVLNTPAITDGNWREAARASFRQLTQISFALTRKISAESWAFHVVNVGLHAINVILVARIAGALGYSAVWTALVFAIHPLGTNAVAYISGRAAVLSALLYFGAIWAVLTGHLLVGVALVPLAILAKEDAVILPLVLVAIRASLWPILVIGLLFAYFNRGRIRELLGQEQTGAQGWINMGLPPLMGWEYRRTAFTENIIRYCGWVIGYGQNVDHDVIMPSRIRTYCAIGVLVIVGAVGLIWHPMILLLLVVTPAVLYSIVVTPDPVMEYRHYASLLGLALAMGVLLEHLPVVAAVFIISVLTSITAYRASRYKSWRTFWQSAIFHGSYKIRTIINLSEAYRQEGDLWSARYWAEQALKLNPDCAPPYEQLAWFADHDGKTDKALELLQESVRRCPRAVSSWEKLGVVYQSLNEYKAAEICYRHAIKLHPLFARVMNHLAVMWMRQGRYKDAIPMLEDAIRLTDDGNREVYRKNLTWACALSGHSSTEVPKTYAIVGVPIEAEVPCV